MSDVMMDEDAQRLYLNSMLSNHELFTLVNGVLRPEYFDAHLAKGVKYVQDYFQENRHVPATSIFTTATKIAVENVELPPHDIQYVAKQIAEFCKTQAVVEVIKKATSVGGYIETNDLGRMVAEMKLATEIGLQEDLGIDYFADPMKRLEDDEKEDPVISTGWKTIDDVIGGGIGLQELVIFLAPSGGGKSVSMLNLAINLLEQGYDGIYISLEMRDKKVARRTDQMIARLSSGLILDNKEKVADEIGKFHARCGAEFRIKRMPATTTNANDIIAYIRALQSAGFMKKLGFVVVDYIDIMSSVRKVAGDNMFLKDKYVSEEVREIGHDFNCIMISASQLEKGATEKIKDGHKMHQGNVQGGSSKTNTADLMIATVKTDAMHEAGEYRFEFPKARNSDAGVKQVTMGWNKNTLKISDMGTDMSFNKKPTVQMADTMPGKKKPGLNDVAKKFGLEMM